MVYLSIYLLATAGLSVIVTKSMLFKPLRDMFKLSEEKLNDWKFSNKPLKANEKIRMFFHKLLTCSLCFGVWAGLFLYWAMKSEWGYWLGCSLAATSVAFLYDRITDRL